MLLRSVRSFRLLLLVLSFGALACDLSDIPAAFGCAAKPAVVITSPPSGSTYHEGEDVSVQSVSTDTKGVDRVEFVVDGIVIRTDRALTPQAQFTLVQTWKATQGAHTIVVRSINVDNVTSDPAAISITVIQGTALGGTPIPGLSPVPPTTAPGGPTSPPAAATATRTSPPPPPPTNTSPPVCPGPPVIASFTASPNPITAGGSTTLSWGAVTNATSAAIDHGIGGVATPGSRTVSPGSTTTYTLTATGCGGVATSQVTVTVNPAPVPVPTQQTPPDGAVFRVFPRVASFDWSNVSYPGGVKYNIEIQINTGTWQPFATATDLASSNYTMSPFSGDNQGRWRVWATSPTAGDSPKSGWWEFRFNTSAAQYSANWVNDDPSTNGITRLDITNSGQTLFVHGYGKCTPTDCDWGTRSGTFNGEPFVILFDFGGGLTHQLSITLNNYAGTQLKVVDVGSASGTHTYFFHK